MFALVNPITAGDVVITILVVIIVFMSVPDLFMHWRKRARGHKWQRSDWKWFVGSGLSLVAALLSEAYFVIYLGHMAP